jgi:hypothetical protein
VAAQNGRIILNGEPIYLRGALDQAYYPETIYTPNSLELNAVFSPKHAAGYSAGCMPAKQSRTGSRQRSGL